MHNGTVITSGSANQRSNTLCIRLWIDVILGDSKIPIDLHISTKSLSLDTVFKGLSGISPPKLKDEWPTLLRGISYPLLVQIIIKVKYLVTISIHLNVYVYWKCDSAILKSISSES